MGGVSATDVRALVERTCREQGVPFHATSETVVATVAALLGVFPKGASGSPDRLDAGRVEPVGVPGGGLDDDEVNDRLDGGALPVEVEGRPLAS
jgi:hypothetical protein